ncbi:hypothetical protein ACQCSU_06465 [Pseudarthrobacter sp. O4]|uniref:hypothetical protein n=1 Tax=Pseudarthrobacter sp. O4 TaxID=3418417 RepID=UPI003CF50FA1
MDDSGTEDNGTQDAYTDPDAARRDAEEGRPGRQHLAGHGVARYARPALIAGGVIAVVCVALLVIIFFLDSFNATVYSVGGKDVTDATDEARSIRESYAAAKVGGTIFLVIGLALAAAGGFLLYRQRNEPGRNDEADDGEEVDFEDLGGQ